MGLAISTAIALATPTIAQEPGWHYSPLPGEGDRASLGCNREATATDFLCIALRCEDDYSVGLYLHSSRPVLGEWQLTTDRETPVPIVAEASSGPYSARIAGDVTELVEALKNGGIAYLDAADGSVSAQIRLNGSLTSIGNALFYCAPRTGTGSGDEVAPVDRQDRAGDEAGER